MGHTGGPVTGSFLGSDADLQNGEKEKVCQWEVEGKGYPTVQLLLWEAPMNLKYFS